MSRGVFGSSARPELNELTKTLMGLDNIPVRRTRRGKKNEEEAFTHRRDELCPFRRINQPLGMLGTCCWLRGKVAAAELNALGLEDLAGRMYDDMDQHEARAFANELVRAADLLEQKYSEVDEKPHGCGRDGVWNRETQEWSFTEYTTFDDAITEVRTAARWYEQVAELGLSVHAWF